MINARSVSLNVKRELNENVSHHGDIWGRDLGYVEARVKHGRCYGNKLSEGVSAV